MTSFNAHIFDPPLGILQPGKIVTLARRFACIALTLSAVTLPGSGFAQAPAQFCTASGDTLTPTFAVEPAMLERSADVLNTTFGQAGISYPGGSETERLFSFKRTIGALLTSAGMADTAANREALVQTMLDSFGVTSNDTDDARVNRKSGVLMPVDDRQAEHDLSPAALLDETSDVGLVPVGLFNRFDLAPTDWVHCGEYRIVYARRNPPDVFHRFFVIFEAAVPNPGAGEQGCRVLTEFWAGLGNVLDTTERAKRLAALYYDGEAGGVKFGDPIISFSNLGGDGVRGQVRSNQFLDADVWQLREWLVQKTFRPEPNGIAFVPNPVNDNPLAELYSDEFATNSELAAINPGALLSLSHGQFFQRFSLEYFSNLLAETTLQHQQLVAGLSRFDLGASAVTPDSVLMNTIALGDTDMFDEYQSSSDEVDEVSAIAGADMRRLITALLQFQTGNAVDQVVDETALLNRAGAATCGGCHMTAARDAIFAPNHSATVWPSTLPFVHIDEKHEISEALSERFLPFRRYVMARHLCGVSPAVETAVAAASSDAATPSAMQSPLRNMRFVENILTNFQSKAGAAPVAAAADETAKANASESAQSAFERVHATIAEARRLEQRVPGAFVQTRRAH